MTPNQRDNEQAFSPAAVADALQSVLRGPAALHAPQFAGREMDYVRECMETGWVSTGGAFVTRFEEMLAAFTGAKHAIATVNGTAALHVALLLAGVQPGDEVIVPALTFVATANAVAYTGATPHFADSEECTLGLDAARLSQYLAQATEQYGGTLRNRTTGRRISAVVCMHTYGMPVDLDPLRALCAENGLVLVEDAAEGLGSRYRGRHVGTDGAIATLSFNANKTITTGGGGALLIADDALAARARHLTTTAKTPHRWEFDHDEVGFNYRLPNLNAAVGCGQMEQLDAFLADKRRLAMAYRDALAPVPGVRFIDEPAFAESNFWLNVMMLDRDFADQRDAVLSETNDRGMQTRPAWRLMHELPMYADCPRMTLPVAEDLYQRLINLPSAPALASRIDG